ncbi:MAG: ATP phosphoribosyltransferase regulatory subunit, partial [Burkholderiales bacterium]|nr:ATP phosphoribosyltransferase regulatory subunit [Burkholderiales bacterium]
MSSAWLLPEHLADVLPAQARHIEELRRRLVDVARGYGCELVMPPLLEYIESLLSGTGRALDLKTFKLVDQLSGRTLGVRADSTPQVARIDAHLLNRVGVTRLCYCGPVLHALPSGLHSTREPLQFGAEIYGHAGLEADLEVLDMALDCLRGAGLSTMVLDLGDARIVRGVLAGVMVSAEQLGEVYAALAAKDAATLRDLSRAFPDATRRALQCLVTLYGGPETIDAARRELPPRPLVQAALDDLESLAQQVGQSHPDVKIGFDLADTGGNGYYSGVRFAVFALGSPDAV